MDSSRGWFMADQNLIYKSEGFDFNKLPNHFIFFDFDNVIIDYAPEIQKHSVTLDYTENIERIPSIFIVISNKGATLNYYSATKRREKIAYMKRVFNEAGKRFKAIHGGKTEFLIILPLNDHTWCKPFPTTWSAFIRPYIGNRRATYIGDAAGRIGDFSVSDRSFVWNINKLEGYNRVRFKTPEEYFKINKKPTINNISGQRKTMSEEKLAEYVWDPNRFYPFRGVRGTKPKIKAATKVVFLIGPPNGGQDLFCQLTGCIPTKSVADARSIVAKGKRVAVGAINKTSQAAFKQVGPHQTIIIDITAAQYWHWVQQRYYSGKLQKLSRSLSISKVLQVIGTESSDRLTTVYNYNDYIRRRSWVGTVDKWRPNIPSGFMYDPIEWNSNWHKINNIRPLGQPKPRSSKKNKD
jgi:CRISPR/Cas system-associated endoribonuclease Cas2